jgi:hypothetical protein
VKKSPIWLVVLFALVVAPFARPAARTTSPNVYITVHITITGSKVKVSPATAPEGSDLRLQVVNTSSKPQRFAFDYTPLASGRHTGFDLVFKPHTQRIFLFALEVEGKLPYYSGRTFDGTSGAKRGLFIVGPQCVECSD